MRLHPFCALCGFSPKLPRVQLRIFKYADECLSNLRARGHLENLKSVSEDNIEIKMVKSLHMP